LKKYPKIDLELNQWNTDQMYCIGDLVYLVEDLWEAAKDLPIFEMPLAGMSTSLIPWDDLSNFHTFCKHAALTNKADLDYPIILDPFGNIADGRHRFAKAIISGHTTIKVQRLKEMPEPYMCYGADVCDEDEE
jgi:hypothetical protein